MSFTRQDARNALEHILSIFDHDDDELTNALEIVKCTTIFDLVSMPPDVIDGLHYSANTKDGKVLNVQVPQCFKAHIKIVQGYVAYRNDLEDPINNNWTAITEDQINAYRVSNYHQVYIKSGIPKAMKPNYPPPTDDPALLNFKRGIKRDPSIFKPFKRQIDWDDWYNHMMVNARGQAVEEVLDPSYKPIGDDSKALFAEKQKYVFQILHNTVMTDKGKQILKAHLDTCDAQTAFQELCAYSLQSTAAKISSSTLLTYITSAKINDGQWRGTTTGFIIHWKEQIRKYHKLVAKEEFFSDSQQKTMLQNAVHAIPELRQVKTNAELQSTISKKDITFTEYDSLLQSSAAQYDSSMSQVKSNRKIYMSDLYAEDDATGHDNNEHFYNIDTDISTIQANMTKSSNRSIPNTRLPNEKWNNLSVDQRNIWNTLSQDAKATILGLSPKTNNTAPRRSMLHDMSAIDLISCIQENQQQEDHGDTKEDDTPDNTILINAASSTANNISPADIRQVLATNHKDTFKNNNEEIEFNGTKYRKVKMHCMYKVSEHKQSHNASLVDRGANGGIAGNDVRIIPHSGTSPHKTVNVMGIDNHQLTSIPIVSVGGVSESQHGPIILIFHQYAHHAKGKSIHSPVQLESFHNEVNDRSTKVGGGQYIKTNDGYMFPLDICDGLPYLQMRPFTDKEWQELPHVIMTSDEDWNPNNLDNTISHNRQWLTDLDTKPGNNPAFDSEGNYQHRTVAKHQLNTLSEQFFDTNLFQDTTLHFFDAQSFDDTDVDTTILSCMEHSRKKTSPIKTTTNEPDYRSLRPFFGWAPTNIIQLTFKHTTQYARTPISTILKKHYKSPFPALNVHRRDEPVATDTIYSDTPAIDDGSKCAQFFVGTKTLYCDIYGMKTDSQFVNTLEDNIRERGAMSKLISDCAQVELSKRVLDVIRSLCISSWQSEPHQQHQNPAERRFQTVKKMTNTLLDRSGSPASTWLLAMTYVCFLLNHLYCASIKGIPAQHLTGSTPDISPLLRFYWWQPVYYKVDDSCFPSNTRELRGRFVGIAEHVGHAMTFKILTDDTSKIISRSNVRSADVPMEYNLRLDPLCGEPKQIVKSKNDTIDDNPDQNEIQQKPMPMIHPSDLVGRSFLLNENENGEKFRAKIVKAIHEHDDKLERNLDNMKFLCSVNDEQYEEILSYNEILHHVERDDNTDLVWKFKDITAHQGPMNRNHPDYKGSSYNIRVEWENGEITYEPLDIIAKDDPVSCAMYAKKNNLLNEPGWKRFKGIAKNEKKLLRMANQAKLRSYRTTPKYKFGFIVPRDYKQAMDLDKKNGNTKFKDCTDLELKQIDDYKTFLDLGKGTKAPDGSKKIGVHLVYDIKHDGRHKARLVADGHRTDIPLTSVYSGVVSLRGLRIVLFLAELNDLKLWATDIGNAYLEAKTQEKVHIIAGPEFGDREGHTLVINKALYGLRSSGLRWHEKLAKILLKMGFTPCKVEPDIWMRKNGTKYEYIAVYVDDLAIAAENPKEITDTLEQEYHFKLKGTGPLEYHLGCDFFRDDLGVLCFSPKRYIDKMLEGYKTLFGNKPKTNVTSPLEKGDHPELDDSELLDEEGISKYQSLIGSLQWAISLGRFDIMTAVMTMSSFRAAPRKGHLERVKRIYSYIAKMRHATIRVRTDEPDFSGLPDEPYQWDYSVYGNVKEELPKDAPEPLGNYVTTTHYVDANLFHDILTGRSVTGILHLFNKTPMDWYSKKQSTVETATYGSEFVAAKTCTEQIIEIRNTLRYLGVPIRSKCYMFGDNESVVNSASMPHAKLHKRHVYLAFHRVREAIAAGILTYRYLPGKDNPADILSKHWGYQQVWSLLQPLLFWQGNTLDLVDKEDSRKDEGTKEGPTLARS